MRTATAHGHGGILLAAFLSSCVFTRVMSPADAMRRALLLFALTPSGANHNELITRS